jgi:hypothetical protein
MIVSLCEVASSEEAIFLHDGLCLSELFARLRKEWMKSELCVYVWVGGWVGGWVGVLMRV